VSPVKYGLGFYIPEDDILHSGRRGNLKSYIFCYVAFRSCGLLADTTFLLSLQTEFRGVISWDPMGH
jgi:hypothetical protein